jgi:hypothetical protein
MDPSLANEAVNPRPAADSAVLKAAIELTLPAATVLLTVMVVAAPVAGVKMKVLPLSELAVPLPMLTRSARRGSLHRITRGRLQHLVGDRLRGIDQLLQRGDAGVGGLQDLHAVADAVEQIADVAGAVVETLRREIVGRVVERRVDLLAGRETVLGGGEKIRGRLQREQVLANRSGKNNTGHVWNLPSLTSVVLPSFL